MPESAIYDRTALQETKARDYFDDMTDPGLRNADEFVELVSGQLNDSVTVRQGHMPELTFHDDRHASGIWAMFDWVDGSARGAMDRVGYSYYHDRYVKGDDDNWRIEELRLTRLRTETTVGVGRVADDQAPWKRS